MDSLNGGSRLSRLPPRFVRTDTVDVVHRRWLQRSAVLLVLVSAMALALTGSAVGALYRAHDAASLQAAVASADASGSASTIELTSGVFSPTATLDIRGNVAITGPSSSAGAELSGSAAEPAPASIFVVEASAKLTLSNVELTAGGGLTAASIVDFGTLDLESSTVAGNGGTGVLVEPEGMATVRNSTLSEGLAFGLVDDGTTSFLNSTVASNKDGGIQNKGSLSLTNTIVAENRGAGDCKGRADASDHSLDSDGTCGVGALSATDAELGMLTANGGPTSTQALAAGSPAIDAADDSKCPADDQRHFARPAGRCDIGAYQTDAAQPGASPPGAGPGSGGSSKGSGLSLFGVSGQGALRGARRTRIAFSVRAEVGHSGTRFRYTDGARHLELTKFTLKSLAIDARTGVATLRGRGVEMPGRRRVSITLVLVSHAAHRSLRIRLSSGYYKSGPLIKGSITFMRRAVQQM